MGKYIFKKKYLSTLSWLSLAGISGSTLLFAGLYLYLSPKLPAVETLRQVQLQTPLRIYSRDNRLIGEFGEKRRYPIAYNDIPRDYIDAILAAEDDQFYAHNGVSIKGLLRAASQLLQSGHIKTGGSTITMQVARNFFLTRNQTFARKFNEILLALQIEQKLSKQEILELYVNKIYLGNRAYGIQASAQVYYGKDISELSLAQLAMIAGLPKAPSAYNPIINPKRALIRRNWILKRMLELEYIDQERYQLAVNEEVSASYHGSPLDLSAPYIAELARKKAIELFGTQAYTEGYRVYTTVDSQLQQKAQQSVAKGLLTYDGRHGYRGPEQTLPLPPTTDTITEADTDGIAQTNFESWLKTLKKLPSYNDLKAAVVTEVGEQSADIIFADGSTATLGWDNGLSKARRYISENRRSAAPKLASSVVSAGDVIRVNNIEGTWHLSQIPEAQAALISLSPSDGSILSMVGGFDFQQSHFNRAIQAARQPGSNFKPFIYTSALENGFTPASIINDAPIVFDDVSLEGTWRPENASGKFFGPTRLRQALYKSRNLVSIRVLQGVGINNALSGLDRFGFETEQMPRDLSLALGSYALTPLQVATGYAVFANGGYRIEPYLIDSIEDVDGEEIYFSQPLTVCPECEQENSDTLTDEQEAPIEIAEETLTSESEAETLPLTDDIAPADIEFEIEAVEINAAPRVLDERVAYIMDSMLRDVIQRGTGRRAKALGRGDIAGKTGTTNGPRDAWFSGYSPDVVTTTWLGFDKNTPLGRNEYGGSAALPIWLDYMKLALSDHPEQATQQPDGLVTIRINPDTGERAQPGDDNAIFEIFRSEKAPQVVESDIIDIDNQESEELPEEIF